MTGWYLARDTRAMNCHFGKKLHLFDTRFLDIDALGVFLFFFIPNILQLFIYMANIFKWEPDRSDEQQQKDF